MECQTCSKTFPTRDTLHEHIGLYQVRTFELTDPSMASSNQTQSRAQHLVRELLECLAHASSSCDKDTGGSKETINIDDDNDENLAETLEEDQSDLDDDDLRCPLPICEQLREFSSLKELQRHYAIRTCPALVSDICC